MAETSVSCALEHIHIPLQVLGVPKGSIPQRESSRRRKFLLAEGWTLVSVSESCALWIPNEGKGFGCTVQAAVINLNSS